MGESMGTFVFDFIERISVFLIITFPGLTARNAQITNSLLQRGTYLQTFLKISVRVRTQPLPFQRSPNGTKRGGGGGAPFTFGD